MRKQRGQAFRRHVVAADAAKFDRRAVPRLQRLHQRGAEPVAGFLASRPERPSCACAARLRRTPTTNMPARSAFCDELLRLRDDGAAGDHRNAGKTGARHPLDGARPDRGQIETPILPGFGAFTSTPMPAGMRMRPLRRNSATRASIWSVPSAASSASTWLLATTTACPTSNGPIARKHLETAAAISAWSRSVGVHAAERAFRRPEFPARPHARPAGESRDPRTSAPCRSADDRRRRRIAGSTRGSTRNVARSKLISCRRRRPHQRADEDHVAAALLRAQPQEPAELRRDPTQ